jgi:hypothetical protein
MERNASGGSGKCKHLRDFLLCGTDGELLDLPLLAKGNEFLYDL